MNDRLLSDLGEVVVEEVRRHWVTRLVPMLRILVGMGLFLAMPFAGHWWWVPLAIGIVLGIQGFWRLHAEFMDRFLITNRRVFRLSGIVDQHLASVPIVRVLDISMRRPFWGQVFGYGHFVFESAAQQQGLREIRFVGRPDLVNAQIQRVIIRSGVGGHFDFDEELASGT